MNMNRHLTDLECNKICEMYRDGVEWKVIAEQLGRNPSAVRFTLIKRGLWKFYFRKLSKTQREDVLRLYVGTDLHVEQIAVKMGISVSSVRHVVYNYLRERKTR